jgi:thioredoxin reductase
VERAPRAGFIVRGQDADGGERSFEARRVLLAVGRRGSPRRLAAEISEAAESTVFYSLADARSFAGQRVLLVGLGDSAMEAAIALSAQPSTNVTMAYRGASFRRGKAKNIAEVRRLVEAGRIQLLLEAEVRRIDAGRVTLETKAGERIIDADAVLALIGSIPPWDLLERSGIKRGRSSAEPQ